MPSQGRAPRQRAPGAARRAGDTLLALEHSGFRDDQAQAFGGAEHGWNRMTGALGELLATV
jgi:hypothetical protein